MRKTNSWHRFLSIMLCICMVLALLPAGVLAADTVSSGDIEPATSTAPESLIVGDNTYEIVMGDSNALSATFTATEAGTVTINPSAMATGDMNGEWEDVPAEYIGIYLGRMYTLTVSGESCYEWPVSVEVAAGDEVTVSLQSFAGNPVKLTVTVGFETSDEDVVGDTEGVAATISFADVANRTIFTTEQQTWESNGIKVTNDKGESRSDVADYCNPARFYSGSNLTIEYPGMSKLVVETNGEEYAIVWADTYTGDNATLIVDGQIVTIKFSAPTDTFSLTNLSAQTRVNKISVYTGPDEETPPHEHSWTDATCTVPKTCSTCGATEGDVAEHGWIDATCTAPKFCPTCGATEGDVAEHSWIDATCIVPKTCAACGATEGDVAEHSWIDATCTAPKTCSSCELTEGEALGHKLVNGVCSACGKAIAASGTCGDNLYWDFDGEGTLTIYGTGTMYNYRKAPWYSNAYAVKKVVISEGVTSIGSYAFDDCRSLSSVVIPKGVTSIGNYAFYLCSSLNNVVIPEGVTSIGDYAFYNCSSLSSVIIPEGVTSIGSYAFSNCHGLSGVVIPEGVPSIGSCVFYNCRGLTSVVLLEGVTSIGDSAFYRCSSLSSVIIPEGVISIGDYAFYDCRSLSGVIIPEGVISIGDSAFYRCSSLSSVIIPEGVTSIGDSAFFSCSSLTSVVIPEGVASIGDSAFSSCSSLTSVEIPEGVTSIGDSAFEDCSSLSSVIIPEGVISIGDSAFSSCSSLTSVEIPEGVTSIGDSAFEDCSSLSSVIIPEGVTSIGDSAFEDCSSLSSVIIPEGVTSIGRYAFDGCSSLTGVVIPEGVTSIGDSAFEDCSSLTGVVIPEGVTSIGSYAFDGCSGLTSVVIPESVTSISSCTFFDCSSLTGVVIPEGVTSIGSYAFDGCSGLTSVVIPDGVTSIGSCAFSGCSSLTSVVIPESVNSIGDSAFSHCSSLTKIDVDENNAHYSSDEAGVLFNKEKTELVKAPGAISGHYIIPEGVTSIVSYAFQNCSSLTSVVIPESVTSISYNAFSGCSSLTSVVISEGVTSIGSCAFQNCSSLSSVVIPEGVTSIGSAAFKNCSSLTSVVIPEGVTSIGSYAFQNCSSLTSVVIPEGVTSIGDHAFEDCSSLTSVVIPEGVTSIGSYAFQNCSSLSSVVIPEGVTSIGNSAFYQCSSLTDVYYRGSEAKWNAISIRNSNDDLTGAAIHYDWCTHEYSAVITAPTCTEQGYTTYTCAICGDSYITDYVDATGHSFNKDGICTGCGVFEPAVLNDDVYEISNAGQLYWFADQVNSVDNTISGKLMKDIIINENVLNADGTLNGDGSDFRMWNTIGIYGFYESVEYAGVFDGNGKTISGVYIDEAGGSCIGLFGAISAEGVVKNLGILDSFVVGNSNVGSLAGRNAGTIMNCYNNATVNGSGYTGGLVGFNTGTITNCYNIGDVYAADYSWYTGGVAGFTQYETINNCYNVGTVCGGYYVGAVVGCNFCSTISNCYYLSGCATDCEGFLQNAIGHDMEEAPLEDVEGSAMAKTSKQFASGEVAYLLQKGYFEQVWGQTIGTDVAPTLGGETVYRVDNCNGDTAYSNADEPLGHSYTNGVCSACGDVKYAITQKGRNLSYEDLIYVIDIFDLVGVDGIDLTKDAGLLIWSVEEFEALAEIAFDAEHANPGLKPYRNTGYYYGSSEGIFTRDLYKEAYYVGYVKLADGSYVYSEPKLYSPAIYAYSMLSKSSTSAETKELCVALLNYISAAQMYFDKSTPAENLVNADLSDEQKALNWENISFNLAPEVPADKQVERDTNVFTGTGKNLLFEEMISIVSIFKIDDSIIADAKEYGTIYWTAEQFAALEGVPSIDNIGAGTKTGMSVYRGNAGQWYSQAPEIAAKNMADTQYFYLGYVIHADGSVSYSGVQSYTVEQYISNTVGKTSTSDEMRAFAQWLYFYERAAELAIG